MSWSSPFGTENPSQARELPIKTADKEARLIADRWIGGIRF